MYLAIYIVIGLIAFIAFWRWGSKDKPGETSDTFVGLAFLVCWPVMLVALSLVGFYLLTIKIAQKVQKVNGNEKTNI